MSRTPEMARGGSVMAPAEGALVTRTESGQGTRNVIVGATLIGAAAILGIVGLTLEAMAAVSVMRRRIDEMEEPPRELARRQWARSMATARAAGEAWRREAAAPTVTAPGRLAATTPQTGSVPDSVRV